jgi:SseB protein C-terminal domain
VPSPYTGRATMSDRTLKAGTTLYFGPPAKPMPDAMVEGISHVLAQVPGILEAHLPQCFIEGDTRGRQVLVIGVRSRDEIPRIAGALVSKMQHLFPPGQGLDILPFQTDALPPGVRKAGCQIQAVEKRAWWKLW